MEAECFADLISRCSPSVVELGALLDHIAWVLLMTTLG